MSDDDKIPPAFPIDRSMIKASEMKEEIYIPPRRSRGRPPTKHGVRSAGSDRIQFDLVIEGIRIRPTKRIVPTKKNLRLAQYYRAWLVQQIDAGKFKLSEEFPDYANQHPERIPAHARTCADVFDAFIRHQEARVARDDLNQATADAHRQILNGSWRPHLGHMMFKDVTASMIDSVADRQGWHKKTFNNAISIIKSAFAFGSRDFAGMHNPAALLRYAKVRKRPNDPFSVQDAETLIAALHSDWGEAQGNYDELRFFTGLRPCEEIALRISDYDRMNGVLNVTKTRARGYERDRTKNGRERRVVLCPRAIAVLDRQLRLRATAVARGIVDHDSLFFAQNGGPIRSLALTGRRWQSTLRRLAIRYRRPYMARSTSVSWNLMIGHEPQWVAGQHGHSEATMWYQYASWVRGAERHEVDAIRRAREATSGAYYWIGRQ